MVKLMGKKRSPNDNRSNAKNPNNPASKAARDNRANQLNPQHSAYHSSRGYSTNDPTPIIPKSKESLRKTLMTSKAARRIQSHADKFWINQLFKARVQRAAAKNKKRK
jgi:hypothetical protein